MQKILSEKPNGFALIDLTCKKHNGKYRHGFHAFYIPSPKSIYIKVNMKQIL